MNEKNDSKNNGQPVDPRIEADWAEVDARRAELNSRDGGDFRRQTILKRLGLLKKAS
jgi:hypothetical protein